MKNEKFSKAKTWYTSEFERFQNNLNGEKSGDVNKLRLTAFNKFKSLNFPTKKNEEWRNTNVAPILQQNFTPVTSEDDVEDDVDISKFIFKGFDCNLLVFVNGLFSERLSKIDEITEDVFVGKLSDFLSKYPELFNQYFSFNSNNQTSFSALNAAYLVDGTIVYLKEDAVLSKPLQVLYLSGHNEGNILIQPKNLIVEIGRAHV